MESTILLVVAAACAVAALIWGRSTRLAQRTWKRVDHALGAEAPATQIAQSAFRRELHTTLLYVAVAVAAATIALVDDVAARVVLALTLIPVALTVAFGRTFLRDARLTEERFDLERRAEEVLTQDQLAPHRWAARLAPTVLPEVAGFEVGKVYQAGTGLMAGDFFDVFNVGPKRVAALIGDVTGHGIEPSITALQAKYLLRLFLHQFRDPAQAVEELNGRMSADGGEEFISLVVAVFDLEAGTLRWASAGHPTAWLWHDREVNPLRSTGPLLLMDPDGTYTSREIPLDAGDVLLLYTDGLAEARNGDNLFGEERVGAMLRRDPGASPEVLCKSLLGAARDFASGPLNDDVAILALRRA